MNLGWRTKLDATLDAQPRGRHCRPMQNLTVAHTVHWLDLVIALGIPVAALSVMTMIEALAESVGWRQRMLKFSWDLTVLSVGVVGGVFALPAMDGLTRSAAVVSGSISVLISIGVGTAIMHLRKDPNHTTGLKSFAGLGLGMAALALPVYYIVTV